MNHFSEGKMDFFFLTRIPVTVVFKLELFILQNNICFNQEDS